MAEFNPDEFIKKGESFDPDKFIAGDGTTAPPSDEPGTLRSFAGGAVQGAVFDPVEGINQLVEHASSNKIGLPASVKKWLDDYKEKYTGEGNTAGKAGQIAGTVASLIPGPTLAAKGLGAVGRLTRLIRTPPAIPAAAKALTGGQIARNVGKGAAAGGAGAAVQPVDEDQGDFAKQKAAQAAVGILSGGLLGTPGAPHAISTAAIWQSIEHFGWGPTFTGLAFMMPSLTGLAAAHHSGPVAGARAIAGGAGKLLQRPGAEYAAGRAAGAVAGPPGAAVIDSIGEQ